MKPLANPLLIVSDNPSLPTGLSRSGRDIATLACTIPQFRVGYMGRGVGNRRKFPFVLYDYPEGGQWGEQYIQEVWEDFSDGQEGIILTCDDLSRRHWFVNPTGLPANLTDFLGPGRNFKRWAYVPVDSTGPNGTTLPKAQVDAALRFDRVLSASEWGAGVLHASGRKDADWLPHGVFTDIFHPITQARELLSWGGITVGCVAANQARKDFPAIFEAFAALRNHYGNRIKFWLHTNALIQYWNVYALASEYGIGYELEVTTALQDYQLALRYGACHCTILPSAGEGFGYPIAESLACGTACITTDYAGGADLVEPACRVRPVTYRVDTQHCVNRAVLSGTAFANAAYGQIEEKERDWSYRSDQLAASVEHLDWAKLRVPWERWLLGGVKC